jgi:hypothetical protein
MLGVKIIVGLFLRFWDVATTTSFIRKDVKHIHIGVGNCEEHPIHYLQKTHVNY